MLWNGGVPADTPDESKGKLSIAGLMTPMFRSCAQIRGDFGEANNSLVQLQACIDAVYLSLCSEARPCAKDRIMVRVPDRKPYS